MKNRLSIVIGSGGVLCAASLGLSKALRREGLTPGMAVGCSGGSIYAATIALGMDPAEAERLTLNLFTSDIFGGYTSNLKSALSGETRFTESSSLIDDNIMFERLQSVFGEKTFSDTVFPLYIVATELYKGERVVISSGKILDAIRASIAIPMIFSPWKIGDQFLVDGAVCDPLPIDVAIQQGSDVIGCGRIRNANTETDEFVHSHDHAFQQHLYEQYPEVHLRILQCRAPRRDHSDIAKFRKAGRHIRHCPNPLHHRTG